MWGWWFIVGRKAAYAEYQPGFWEVDHFTARSGTMK